MKSKMKEITQEVLEVEIANATKPVSNSNIAYPLNSLDDRLFEILTYSIFKKRISYKDSALLKFDDIVLMQGVNEKGMDCILLKNSKISGIIQCKKYRNNISDILILSELIKFALHVITKSIPLQISTKFTYFISTTTGYTGKANLLFPILKNGEFMNQYDIEGITEKIINKYKDFNSIIFSDIKESLIKKIKQFDFVLINPSDYNIWINDYPDIIDSFFEIKKVTDNSLIEIKAKEIIQKVTEIFSSKESIDIEVFSKHYIQVALEKLNVVNFIGFDIQKHRQKPENVTLTDLFVQPSFQHRKFDKERKIMSVVDKALKVSNIFKTEKNLIILGDPGAGKSLLVKYIMVKILAKEAETIGLKQFNEFLPIRIELRKFNEVSEHKSIIEYIIDILNREYQTNISIKHLEKIFENKYTIVFFDGLDEIFNSTHKARMKELIESFSNRFGLSKCVVTSRFIGYHDLKFNNTNFDEFAILKFDEIQVKDLVQNFYATQHSSLEKIRNNVENCLRQLTEDVDAELKTNPLILTLILILASNNIIIPDSKLEIYEACTKTLVDSMDVKEKELKFDVHVKNKNLIFAHLAHWQYEALTKNQEISFAKATNTIANLLLLRKECLDYNEAEEKAQLFLEYAERRSIYFENNFTHKTFLEYFTSEYLYSTCIAKASDIGRKKLIETVTKYLPNSFWYIVFELLFTRIDRVQPDNELLDEIFSKQIDSNSLDVFYFFISNLKRLNNLSKAVKQKIIQKTIHLCIKGEKMKGNKTGFQFEENSISYKLCALESDSETFKLLQETFTYFEKDSLNDTNKIELYNLYYEITYNFRNRDEKGKLELVDKSSLERLALKNLLLFSNVYLSGWNKTVKFNISILVTQIENFGIKSLFENIPIKKSNAWRINSFDLYFLTIIESTDFSTFKSDINILSEYGLKNAYILNHFKNTNLLFYVRSESLEKILKLYLKSDEKDIDNLLESIIIRNTELTGAYKKFRKENRNSKLRRIDKIFGMK